MPQVPWPNFLEVDFWNKGFERAQGSRCGAENAVTAGVDRLQRPLLGEVQRHPSEVQDWPPPSLILLFLCPHYFSPCGSLQCVESALIILGLPIGLTLSLHMHQARSVRFHGA